MDTVWVSSSFTSQREAEEWELCFFSLYVLPAAPIFSSDLGLPLFSSTLSKYLISCLVLFKACDLDFDQTYCHWFATPAERPIDCFITEEEAMKIGLLKEDKLLNNAPSALVQQSYHY